jgi:hypothetical protein
VKANLVPMILVPAPLNQRRGALLLYGGLISIVGSIVLFAAGNDTDLWLLIAGLLLGAAGFWLRLRKEPLTWTGQAFTIQPGLGCRPATHPLWPSSKVVLGWTPQGPNHEAHWMLGIDLAGDGHLQPLPELEGLHHGDLRVIAEALCKQAQVPLIDTTDHANPLILPASDLDLPLSERLRRYPQLRLNQRALPHDCGLHDVMQGDGSRVLTYHPRWATPFTSLVGATLLVSLGWYASTAEMDAHTWDLVLAGGVATLVAVVGSLYCGLHGEVRLHRGDVTSTLKLGPLPLYSQHLAAQEIEEVRDLPYAVEVVSDRLILTLPFDLQAIVHYVAYEIQHTLEHQAQASQAQSLSATTQSTPT